MTPTETIPTYQDMLPADLVECWEERAAIMEYDGGLTRELAEWSAFLAVQGLDPA